MAPSNLLARQGTRLQQIGVGLLLFTSFWGFIFPNLASVRLGLSVHTLNALLAVLLLSLGSTWRRLVLPTTTARVAFWLLVYSGLAIDAAYVLGALWGAGSETMKLAAGDARGTELQEAVIKAVAYSSGPNGIISFVLIFWGLHRGVTALEGGR